MGSGLPLLRAGFEQGLQHTASSCRSASAWSVAAASAVIRSGLAESGAARGSALPARRFARRFGRRFGRRFSRSLVSSTEPPRTIGRTREIPTGLVGDGVVSWAVPAFCTSVANSLDNQAVWFIKLYLNRREEC